MLKLALKHFILEGCINVLFNNISNNFVSKAKFNVGDVLRRITLFYWDDDITYVTYLHNVKILSHSNGVYNCRCGLMVLGEEDPDINGNNCNTNKHFIHNNKFYEFTKISDSSEDFTFSEKEVSDIVK